MGAKGGKGKGSGGGRRRGSRRGGVEAGATGLESGGRDGGCGRSSAGSVCASRRPRGTWREGGRRALLAGRGCGVPGTGGREEARRGARTLARGRAHLPARGARPPARTRPRLPSRHGPRNPASEASDGRARGNGGRPGCRVRAHLALAPGEGDLASFPLPAVSVGAQVGTAAFLHGEGRVSRLVVEGWKNKASLDPL